tara:strand:- start:1027 stop:2397 length:1371 start_codon:yes stop_codon:yes gene_type:complete
MSFEWSVFEIRDVAKVITGKTPPGTLEKYFGGNTLFVTPTDMVDEKEIVKTSRNLSTDGEKVLSRIIFDKGIAVSCIGWQMGKSAVVRSRAVSNQQINTVIVDESKINFDFLFYVLKSKRSEIFNLGATATRTPILKKSLFEKIKFKAPDLKTQQNIANILSEFDEKIALNKRISETLEKVAQAVFKSWFVDFEPIKAKISAREALLAENPDATPEQVATTEQKAAIQLIASAGDVIPTEQLQIIADLFPNRLVESELGEIPDSWEVNRLIELINITGGGTPKRSESSFWGGDISWFSVRDVPNSSDIFVTRTEEKITELGLKKSSTKLIPKGSTIITARGTVGKLALVAEDMCMNQSCYAISSDRFGDFYNYFNLRQSVETLQRNSHGAVFDTITTRTFETYSLAYGGDEISSVFNTVVEPIMKRIELNVRQNSVLSEVRDTLLPQLLSGQMQAI